MLLEMVILISYTDKVSYGLGSSSVSYHACFHDLPDALQTHVYAPLGLDIRAKWTVGGSLPGEPKQAEELGLGIPREGLYIREDIKMKCNIMMVSFVKKTFKEAHSKLVDRLVQKAHINEAKAANERLAAAQSPALGNHSPAMTPAQRHVSMYSNASSGHTGSPLGSPGLQHTPTFGAQHGLLSPPYSAIDPAYQAANPYANDLAKSDPRWSQYPPNPTHDPRVSQYAPAPTNEQRYSQYPSDSKSDQRYSYQAYQPPPAELGSHEPPAHRPQGNQGPPAPVELPSNVQSEPAELA